MIYPIDSYSRLCLYVSYYSCRARAWWQRMSGYRSGHVKSVCTGRVGAGVGVRPGTIGVTSMSKKRNALCWVQSVGSVQVKPVSGDQSVLFMGDWCVLRVYMGIKTNTHSCLGAKVWHVCWQQSTLNPHYSDEFQHPDHVHQCTCHRIPIFATPVLS